MQYATIDRVIIDEEVIAYSYFLNEGEAEHIEEEWRTLNLNKMEYIQCYRLLNVRRPM